VLPLPPVPLRCSTPCVVTPPRASARSTRISSTPARRASPFTGSRASLITQSSSDRRWATSTALRGASASTTPLPTSWPLSLARRRAPRPGPAAPPPRRPGPTACAPARGAHGAGQRRTSSSLGRRSLTSSRLPPRPAPRACPPACAPAGRVSVGRGRRQAPLSDYEENVKLLIAALQDVNATVALRTCRRAACCAAARGVRGSEKRALEWLQHYIRSRMHFGSGTLTPLTRADTLERVGAVAHGRRAARRDA